MDNFTCARCKQDFNESDEVVYCPACEAYHHQECWDKAGGCANPKCEEYVPSKFTPKPAKSTKNTSQKRNVARAHSSESIDENIEKLYTLRAGISMISMEYDRAKSEDEKLAKQYKKIEYFSDYDISKLERETNEFRRSPGYEKAKSVEAYRKRSKREKVVFSIARYIGIPLCFIGVLVSAVLFFYFAATTKYNEPGQIALCAGIAFFIAGMGGGAFFYSDNFIYRETDLKKYEENLSQLIKLKDKKDLTNSCNSIAEKNNSKIDKLRNEAAKNSEKYGSAMFEALRKQFAEFLSPADWENIDLLIFYFETGRALTLREALQLVDKQRQADMIVEAIESATQRICNTINYGMLNLQNTIIGCASVLSAQLSSIQAQQDQILSNQRQLQVEASTLQSALKSKSNTSSKQLMEDVHQLRVYADNLEVIRRNS